MKNAYSCLHNIESLFIIHLVKFRIIRVIIHDNIDPRFVGFFICCSHVQNTFFIIYVVNTIDGIIDTQPFAQVKLSHLTRFSITYQNTTTILVILINVGLM